MEYFQLTTIPLIATITYFIIELIKYTTNNSEKFKRLIPLISTCIGMILGLIIYYAIPSLMNESNLFMAIVKGGASGLSATGFNQIIKQLKKNESTDQNNDNDTKPK